MAVAVEQPQRAWRMSLERYHELIESGFFDEDERLELIDGTLIEMSPKGPAHDDVIEWLTEQLVLALRGTAKVRIQSALTLPDAGSEPEPDVAIVPIDGKRPYHPSSPLLVIEVAASSLAYDRGTKARIYARAGVPEYWVVDLAGRGVDVHLEPGDGGFRTLRRVESGTLVPTRLATVSLDVTELLAAARQP